MGIVKGQPVLDLDYSEDSQADTDMNLIMTSKGKFVEIQGTAEKDPFSDEQLATLLALGRKGCTQLCEIQKDLLGRLDC